MMKASSSMRQASQGRRGITRAGVLAPRMHSVNSRLTLKHINMAPCKAPTRMAPWKSSGPETEVSTIEATKQASENGHSSEVAGGTSVTNVTSESLPLGLMEYKEPSGMDQFWTKCKLIFALPWRRFKKDSVLVFKLEGDVSDMSRGRFDPGLSVPQICMALRKAALDPRVKGLAIEIGPLGTGWAKLQEIRRHMKYFRDSGKFTMVYMKQCGEKEYYLASACEEIYAPPSASFSLRGFAVTGTFLRGILEKIGVEPQVKRIGKYKSAGDQILRKDMSEPQAEQLNAILHDIYEEFLTTVSEARGKTKEELVALLEEGVYDMERFLKDGWVTALKYEDELLEDLKARTGGNPDELRKVELRRYSKVKPSTFGLTGKKRVVVLRTSGAIIGGGGTGGTITPGALIPKLRALAKDKGVAAVVLRVDSPGGDALASDLLWREIRKLGEKKPVVASMGDVAASGGYYMGMACKTIVAEPLTITGSIGVVTGKFNLAEIYEKIGYTKTILSKGKYAELLADNRAFTTDEAELFDASATHAYEAFRNKAALSRGMAIESMQDVAQGRVWTGSAALERGLVDALGGVGRAVAIAKKMADIPEDEQVTVLELGRMNTSPLTLLGAGASASTSSGLVQAAITALLGSQASSGYGSPSGLNEVASTSLALMMTMLSQLQSGRMSYMMTEVDAQQLGSLGGAGNMVESSSEGFLSEGESESRVFDFLDMFSPEE